MKIRQIIYDKLVNSQIGIRERYHNYRKRRNGRIGAWIYLLILNFQYYILKRQELGISISVAHDKKIKILSRSEEHTSELQSLG